MKMKLKTCPSNKLTPEQARLLIKTIEEVEKEEAGD